MIWVFKVYNRKIKITYTQSDRQIIIMYMLKNIKKMRMNATKKCDLMQSYVLENKQNYKHLFITQKKIA